jgi:hypothetical protein
MTDATLIGSGLARELALEREREIARRTARLRAPALAEAMPAVSLISGVLLALAIGAPTGP